MTAQGRCPAQPRRTTFGTAHGILGLPRPSRNDGGAHVAHLVRQAGANSHDDSISSEIPLSRRSSQWARQPTIPITRRSRSASPVVGLTRARG
jgi:hypothetical protein